MATRSGGGSSSRRRATRSCACWPGGRSTRSTSGSAGSYKAPRRTDLRTLEEPLKRARDAALETIRWVSGFDFPAADRAYLFVSLSHPDEYPFNEGRIVSSDGLDIPAADYEAHFAEQHVAHSHALQARLDAPALIWSDRWPATPLNHDRLTPAARQAAAEAGLGLRLPNPFQSIVVRGVEILYACEEALRIIEAYEEPDAPRSRSSRGRESATR